MALGTWLGFQLVRQNGGLLLRLEIIENQLAPRAGAKPREAAGLPIGMAAPDFELPDLTGVRHRLSEFREWDVLLIFFNPRCGYCTKMAPDLAALPEGGDRAVRVVVSPPRAGANPRTYIEPPHTGQRNAAVAASSLALATCRAKIAPLNADFRGPKNNQRSYKCR